MIRNPLRHDGEDHGDDHGDGVPREGDVPTDPALANDRSPGGDAEAAQGDPDAHPDLHSATGTTPNDTFVGRVTGQDVGYAGETGAERRAEADQD